MAKKQSKNAQETTELRKALHEALWVPHMEVIGSESNMVWITGPWVPDPEENFPEEFDRVYSLEDVLEVIQIVAENGPMEHRSESQAIFMMLHNNYVRLK